MFVSHVRTLYVRFFLYLCNPKLRRPRLPAYVLWFERTVGVHLEPHPLEKVLIVRRLAAPTVSESDSEVNVLIK